MTDKTDLLERRAKLSPTKRALLEKRLQGNATFSQEVQTIPRYPASASHPLSFAQERFWLLDQLEPGNLAYHRPVPLRLTGPLKVAALEQSLSEIIARHDILRTLFPSREGQPQQVITPAKPLKLPLVDLTALPPVEREAQAGQLAMAEVQQRFNLAQELALRAKLLRLADREHLLLLVMHHIIFDSWSGKVLIKELSSLYEAFSTGQGSPLPPLPLQYTDFARWQQEWFRSPVASAVGQGEALETQLTYWKRQLANAPRRLDLPTDHPRPAIQSYKGACQNSTIPAPLLDSLKALSRQENVTLFMTLLAAFQSLLHRYTGQVDLVVGSPVAGRTQAETEQLIGCFLNTLVLRTDLAGNPSFRELLGRVREVALAAYTHQHLPFEKLLETLRLERDLSAPPLFQVMFNLENLPEQRGLGGALAIHEVRFESSAAAFDLTLEVIEEAEGLSCIWQYNSDLFEAATISRMANYYQNLLQSIVAHPNQRLSNLPFLSEDERRQLLVTWNETQADYPHDQTLVQLFVEQVERTPEGIAYICEGERLSYRELNRRANQVAHYLQTLGVGPEVVVGLCLERSLEMVIGLLGIIKAGGAYLPLDPTYPAQRLTFMLADAGVQVLLTQEQLVDKLPGSAATLVRIDTDWPAIARQSFENPVNNLLPDQPAYVIYTSGSTGDPKGVLGLHRATTNRCAWMWSAYPFQAGEVCCHKTTLSFVDSVWEIFGPLLQGIPTLLIPDPAAKDPPQLIQLLTDSQVSRLVLVPSLLQALLETEPHLSKRLPRLKYWITSGEALSPALYHQFQSAMPQACLLNLYGSSEVAADATWFEPGQGELLSPIPIGRPVANTQVYILDCHLHPTPIGVAGELHIGGIGLARGYLQRPELTAERFIPNPFSLQAGERLYKTGDLARYRPDGNIEFLGRLDHQLKIRGFRIEPGEVEAVLAQHPGVRQAAVAASDPTGDAFEQRLVAYVVVDQSVETIRSELRNFLREKLPEYMIPSSFIRLEALPLTPSGKINRRALPASDQAHLKLPDPFMPPGDALELKLARLWEEVLAVKPIGIRDNFFELGGHSLLAIRLFARIEQVFGQTLPPASLFQASTIERLADLLRPAEPTPYSPLVMIQPGGSRPPFFWAHAIGGHVLSYRNLAHYLGQNQPVYGLQAHGLNGKEAPHTQLQSMAADYLEAIRALQPQGPYFLGGLSFGGLIAFEMAQQLYVQQEQIALLALFDTYAPSYLGAASRTVRYKLYHFLQRVDFHLGNLLYFKPQDKQIYLRERLKVIQQRLRQHFPRFQLQAAEPTLPASVRQVQEANSQAIRSYVAQPYPGRITLFRARRQPPRYPRDPYLGWGELAGGGIEIHEVPGYHISLIGEPHVRILAEKLKACLQRDQVALE
jgi:amino acid adenylation domain-containing protein